VLADELKVEVRIEAEVHASLKRLHASMNARTTSRGVPRQKEPGTNRWLANDTTSEQVL